MKRILALLLFLFCIISARAGHISGIVKDTKGNILSFASIVVKGTSKGAVANAGGKYQIFLDPGTYTLVCQYVGYKSEQKMITVSNDDLTLDFTLAIQELTMEEVVIRRGDDPAIEIMKQTIKKRSYYNNQVDSFSVDVYIKGLLRTRKIPDRMLGQKIDKSDMEKQGFDSLGAGILFLSESQTRVSFTKPDKIKYEVISSRQSGGGYGIAFPFFINFYSNNVEVFQGLNPRGFISPISENAFHYYKFHYEGNFFEGKKMIDRIKVTPKRKYEPLFQGYIEIVDEEWRLHSVDLLTTKDYTLEVLDTVHITQIHAPVDTAVWRTQNQVVYLSANTFGVEWTGNFLNVYTNYNLNPGFGKKHFDRIVMSYDTAFDKKDSTYWNKTRPLPLEKDEQRDFVFRDSLYKSIRDSFYTRTNIDSMNKRQHPVTVGSFLIGGVQRTHFYYNGSTVYSLNPLLRELEYNTVEGLAINVEQSLRLRPRTGKNDFEWTLALRYGLSNQHFNSFAGFSIKPKGENFRNRYFTISGGKRISQFNNDNPISNFTNTIYTLLYKRNYAKYYENWFGTAEYNNRFKNGISWKINAVFEDRIPVVNTTDASLFAKSREFSPNHPEELVNIPFNKHKALVASITLTYQPGQRYIQLPKTLVPISSKYPTFEIGYSKGIKDLLGSDVDFDKWNFAVYDDVDMKVGGLLKYKLGIGGFINTNKVEIPDMKHFIGNLTRQSARYLNSFQIAPYYRYSNTEKFYAVGHLEHHFNGMLTNKVPGLKKLKWNLVMGSNAFYVNENNYYVEAFAGLENIFKLFRVDFVTAYQTEPGHTVGIRIGLGGILGSAINLRK